MGLFSFLTGKKDSQSGQSETRAGDPTPYNGFTIIPAPSQQSGQFLAAGVIRKTFAEGDKESSFIRADAHSTWDDACTTAINKAKRIIDEQGDGLFKE